MMIAHYVGSRIDELYDTLLTVDEFLVSFGRSLRKGR